MGGALRPVGLRTSALHEMHEQKTVCREIEDVKKTEPSHVNANPTTKQSHNYNTKRSKIHSNHIEKIEAGLRVGWLASGIEVGWMALLLTYSEAIL